MSPGGRGRSWCITINHVSGFLAAKATARSPRVSPKNTQPCLLAVSLGAWRIGTARSREPLPTTACDRCSSQACPCLLPNRRQRTEQRYSECLQVSPPAMSHNPLPGLTGQVPNLIAGSSRSEICCFGEPRNREAFSSGKPQQGHTSPHTVSCKPRVCPCHSACGGVSSHPPGVGLVTCALMQHTQRRVVCLLIC